jgi:hypothetical protein
VFGQRGSSSAEDQHTHRLSRGQRRVRSARLEIQRINTLTTCQGVSDVFGQRGSSSTEDQHTHILSRDQRRVRSARLELHRESTHSPPVKSQRRVRSARPELRRGSTHSPTVKGSATCSVSEAQAPQRINTLTHCQEATCSVSMLAKMIRCTTYK